MTKVADEEAVENAQGAKRQVRTSVKVGGCHVLMTSLIPTCRYTMRPEAQVSARSVGRTQWLLRLRSGVAETRAKWLTMCALPAANSFLNQL